MGNTKKFQRVEIPDTTRKFYFNFSRLTFAAGTKACFLDEYYYEMKHEARMQGERLMVSLEDLETIYSPDMAAERGDGRVRLALRGGSAEAELLDDAGVPYVADAPKILARLLGWEIQRFASPALAEFVSVNSPTQGLSVQAAHRIQLVTEGHAHGALCGPY